MECQYKITVFTPTYNRAYIIENLYNSLRRQTFKDFEWLVVDDGSTDNTEELFSKWITENKNFNLRFYKKQNGGKHSAINYGLDLAEGELFFIVDSDDFLTDDALEKVNYWESTIKDKSKYCGFMGQRGISPTETPNRRILPPYRDGNSFDRYEECTDDVIDGERADVWYTEVHRKYKYPEFDGEKFVTESVVWNRMSNDGFKIRYFDDIIWICKYLDDGLTKTGTDLFLKNPKAHGLWLREKAEFCNYSIVKKMMMWYNYYCDFTVCDEKYRLTKKQCAEYINAPILAMYISSFINKLSNLTKKIRG